MKKISVIIPVYNAEKFLKRCLDSVLNQSLKEIEIICVDDSSKDNSLSILKRYESLDSRIKVLTQERNKGVSCSRNIALQEAIGEYIYFLDADDYLENDAFEHLYNYVQKYNADLCFFKTNLIPDSDMDVSGIQPGITGSYVGKYTGDELLEKFVNKKEFFYYPCMLLYRRVFLKENNIYFRNLKIGEGGEFVLHSLMFANTAIVYDGKFHNYYIHQESATNSNQDKNLVLIGQIAQYSSVLKHSIYCKNTIGIKTFLDYQFTKMSGGIKNLTYEEIKHIYDKLEDFFTKHIFSILLKAKELKEVKFSKEQLDIIRQREKVILYGAGNSVSAMLELLNKHKIVLDAFAVSNKKNNSDVLYGHRVYQINELTKIAKKCIVIIAVKYKYHNDIITKLKSLGFDLYICIDTGI